MPSRLASVKQRIESLLNEENRRIVHEFTTFMETTDTSENYRRGNLIVVIFLAKYLDGKGLSESTVNKEDITGFLNSKKKDIAVDPDKR